MPASATASGARSMLAAATRMHMSTSDRGPLPLKLAALGTSDGALRHQLRSAPVVIEAIVAGRMRRR